MTKSLLISVLIFTFFVEIGNSQTLTYLALGDSYTIGESVKEDERYPNQLVKILKNNGLPITNALIIAKTGWTTDELKKAMTDAKIMDQKFDFVSLLIGVNNQYRGRDKEQYRTELKELLQDAITLAKGNKKHVFVVSIPDWYYSPFGKKSPKKDISKNIDAYNAVKKEATEKLGIQFIDITPISRQADQDPSLIAGDGLHPSGKMYGFWVQKIISEYKFNK